jgi:hypothetical protein
MGNGVEEDGCGVLPEKKKKKWTEQNYKNPLYSRSPCPPKYEA